MSLQLFLHQRSVRIGIVLVGIGLLLFIGLYNQPYYPKTWQDEGFVLQGALNLARYGQYAMKSSEGFRLLDQPLIANGPGVVLPITAAFYFLGIGLIQARLVMIVFLVIVTVLFFVLANRLYGVSAAIISVLLLLAVPS